LREMLGESLGLDGGIFHFSNDAACFLQGELFSGEDDPSLNVAGFTIGTGFGSALAKDGIAVDADLWCAPFKEGTVEDYFSTRWFIKEVRDRKGETVSDVKSLTDRKTDPVVEGIFNDFGENLACFLIEFYPNWNWEKVVLGGNISHAYALFAPALERTLEQAGCGIQIRVSTLGENAVLMGAASNASRFFKKNMQIR
ncbi:MAG TPA: ROK family protein, partial [Flavihumibacter sp.]